jgi:hypothetical protein
MNIINKNNMEKYFQSGGSIIDEDELFERRWPRRAKHIFRRSIRRKLVGGREILIQLLLIILSLQVM